MGVEISHRRVTKFWQWFKEMQKEKDATKSNIKKRKFLIQLTNKRNVLHMSMSAANIKRRITEKALAQSSKQICLHSLVMIS